MDKEALISLQELVNVVKVSKRLQHLKRSEYIKYPYRHSNHYEFLYLLTYLVKPKLVVELGTYKGLSMLYMMEGYPKAIFYTVDINPDAGVFLENKMINRIFGDSVECADQIPNDIDILFDDTDHEYDTLKNEFKTYLPKMKKGGIVLFDDVNDKLCPGAKKWWKELDYPTKINFPKIHLGYGMSAIIKDS